MAPSFVRGDSNVPVYFTSENSENFSNLALNKLGEFFKFGTEYFVRCDAIYKV